MRMTRTDGQTYRWTTQKHLASSPSCRLFTGIFYEVTLKKQTLGLVF